MLSLSDVHRFCSGLVLKSFMMHSTLNLFPKGDIHCLALEFGMIDRHARMKCEVGMKFIEYILPIVA